MPFLYLTILCFPCVCCFVFRERVYVALFIYVEWLNYAFFVLLLHFPALFAVLTNRRIAVYRYKYCFYLYIVYVFDRFCLIHIYYNICLVCSNARFLDRFVCDSFANVYVLLHILYETPNCCVRYIEMISRYIYIYIYMLWDARI